MKYVLDAPKISKNVKLGDMKLIMYLKSITYEQYGQALKRLSQPFD
jgi:hypothetical protein